MGIILLPANRLLEIFISEANALEWRQNACGAQNIPKAKFVFGIFCMYPGCNHFDGTTRISDAYQSGLLWSEGKRTS